MTKYLHTKDHYKYLAMQKGYVYPVNMLQCVAGDVVKLKTEGILESLPMINPLLHPTHHEVHHFWIPETAFFPDFDSWFSGDQKRQHFGYTRSGLSQDFQIGGNFDLGHIDADKSKVMPKLKFRILTTLGSTTQDTTTRAKYVSLMLNSFWRQIGVYMSYSIETMDSLNLPGGAVNQTITVSPKAIMAYMYVFNEYLRDPDLDLIYDKTQINRAVPVGTSNDEFYIYNSDMGTAKSFSFSVTYNKSDCFDPEYTQYITKLLSVFLSDMFKKYLDKALDGSDENLTKLEIFTPLLYKINSQKDYFTSARPYETQTNISDLEYDLDSNGDGKIDKNDKITITNRDLRLSEILKRMSEFAIRTSYSMKALMKKNFNVKSYKDQKGCIRYIGGTKNTVDYFKVMGTSGDNLAEKGGNSTTYLKSKPLNFYANEYGFIFTISYLRYNNLYYSGVDYYHLQSGNLDFYRPEFAGLGKDQIKVAELFLDQRPSLGDDLILKYSDKNWGFKDMYDEVRTEHSRVLSSEFVQKHSPWNTWLLGEYFGHGQTHEALNSAFIKQRNNTRPYLNVNENLNGANQMAIFYNLYRTRNNIPIKPTYSF